MDARCPRSITRLGAALASAILVSGCVLTLDAIVPESAAIFDVRLIGAWEQGSDRAVFARGPGNSYTIEYTSDGRTGTFEGRLGRLGDRLVLDIQPAPGGGDLPEPYAGLLVGAHVLLALEIGNNEVRVAALDSDRFRAAPPSHIPFVRRSNDQLILYGTAQELAPALASYLGRPDVLATPDVWRRAGGSPTAPARPVDVPCFEASAWREADQLFHRDPHWLGADTASSVDLGGGRTLWLFSDTWIDPSGRGTRSGGKMVSNSLAVQTGADPSAAAMSFYWGKAADGGPAAFFADRGDERLWFGSGVRVDDRLVLFLGRIRSAKTGLGFQSAGWTAIMVDNPDSPPSSWRVRTLETPPNPLGITVGFAAALKIGEYVYAFGAADPVKSHPLYVARWPAADVRRGNLQGPEWWTGDRLGWVPDTSSAPRWPLFEDGQTELTIHLDRGTQRFIAVQTQGFGPADVMMRAAPALTGPWTAARMVYRPPEYYRPNVMIYAGKAHSELAGADLVLTYASNTFQFGEHLTDPQIYYPRFVRLMRCR